jgi:hypothetical protein
MSGGQEQVQTFGEAKTTILTSVQSSFASLAKMLGIPQLKESFYQNIIYIFIVIVIMVGILVYMQIVGAESNNPLFAPPTKEVKKVEIKKIVEGFDTNVDFGSKDIGSAADVSDKSNAHDLHEGYLEHEYENNNDKKRK